MGIVNRSECRHRSRANEGIDHVVRSRFHFVRQKLKWKLPTEARTVFRRNHSAVPRKSVKDVGKHKKVDNITLRTTSSLRGVSEPVLRCARVHPPTSTTIIIIQGSSSCTIVIAVVTFNTCRFLRKDNSVRLATVSDDDSTTLMRGHR